MSRPYDERSRRTDQIIGQLAVAGAILLVAAIVMALIMLLDR